jgi:vacuolar-type H+-ATPase subunit H
MAKARMKSNKERGSSQATVHSEDRTHIPIREESVEYSREEIMRDTKSEVNTDIDFTGDLD